MTQEQIYKTLKLTEEKEDTTKRLHEVEKTLSFYESYATEFISIGVGVAVRKCDLHRNHFIAFLKEEVKRFKQQIKNIEDTLYL